MVAALDGGLIVSGHDGSSLALWTVREDQLSLRSLLDYDKNLAQRRARWWFHVASRRSWSLVMRAAL
jgi:hypothetical protein